MKARNAKGTRDFDAAAVSARRYVIGALQRVFERYAYAPLETPSFENSETLLGKYGEEGDRLIFKILKSGDFMRSVADGEAPKASQISDKALRYDLTVPFARYVVQNFGNIPVPFKRYQIQPVWRADNPQKGRFREFYQCDADVVGSKSLWQEVELVQLYADAFRELGMSVTIRMNHRGILAAIAEVAGVGDRLVPFTVALDKLDKIGEDGVIAELQSKGFTEDEIVALKPSFVASSSVEEALTQMEEWLGATDQGREAVDALRFVVGHVGDGVNLGLDITLARGLDYYTGCIFEVTADDVAMGSVGGGGRYDDLTGIFGREGLPGVGISFGLDRIILCLEELGLIPSDLGISPKVLVLNCSEAESAYAYRAVKILRDADISADLYPDAVKLQKQFDYAEQRGIAYALYAGEQEAANQEVKLKNLNTGDQVVLALGDLVNHMQSL